MLNGLRDRIVVQVDGQLKTGRDVVIAALLGAEEFGFATAPLVVSGCIMMRVCHLDTCPVGIATQNPELRARFSGKPEFVETFFEYIAEEVREHLAALGFRSHRGGRRPGRAPRHRQGRSTHWKAAGLDLSPDLRRRSTAPTARAIRHVTDAGPRAREGAGPPAHRAAPRTRIERRHAGRAARSPVRNVNRTVGTMLGHEVTKAPPATGCPTTRSTSPSPGRPASRSARSCRAGVTLQPVSATPTTTSARACPAAASSSVPTARRPLVAEENVIAGNVIGYGATSGELFLRGLVGERFCVRNSGATAVVEGVGDHGCEYMTGGIVVVLGPTGRNFAAGMSGGVAYVLDLDPSLVNRELVDLVPLRPRRRGRGPRPARAAPASATDSAVAGRLLDDWDAAQRRFTLVLPRDYQRVLDVRDQAQAEGLDPDGAEVWSRIMEASRG